MSSKLAYLHGLSEGLGLETQEGDPARLLRGILDVLDTFADELEELTAQSADLEDAILEMRRDDGRRTTMVQCENCGEMLAVDKEALDEGDVIMTCPQCEHEIDAHGRRPHRAHGHDGEEVDRLH